MPKRCFAVLVIGVLLLDAVNARASDACAAAVPDTLRAVISGQYPKFRLPRQSPGKYERTEALDGPVSEPGERESYTSKRQGIVAGTIESSGAAFFFDGNAWIHVWISD